MAVCCKFAPDHQIKQLDSESGVIFHMNIFNNTYSHGTGKAKDDKLSCRLSSRCSRDKSSLFGSASVRTDTVHGRASSAYPVTGAVPVNRCPLVAFFDYFWHFVP
mmetsp:Transcript_13844/g.27872  ORF Transcript_13844/g.27872 Transcript_13844/m.27872 type:complete len:105 (+) Transcript_13844:68-382(+)